MIGGRRYEFGVTGLLYRRNAIFYDRQTDSLWSQLLAEAVTGPLAGTHLVVLPAEHTAWEAWEKAHPETKLLSFDTGYPRDYKQDPYAAYPFPRRPALLISVGGVTKIYPFAELKKVDSPVVDHVGGHAVTILFDRRSKTARVSDDAVTSFVSYLDDLKVFYPGVEIYQARR